MTVWIVLAAGAAGSIGLLLHAAGRGVSPVLVLVMIAWVVAPFVAMAVARRWLNHALIVLITLGAVTIYAIDAVRRLNAKAAFVYVVVPLIVWVAIAASLLAGRMRKARARTQ
jgi:hypothetical protein